MQPRDDTHLRELYDAELFLLDIEVDRFLGELDLARGDTAVLMCSDHGEAFGEGGRYEHNDILEPQVHIPFLLHAPRESSARRVTVPVSGIDVAPTLLALAGLSLPAHFTGVDVGRLDLDPASATRRILVEDRDQMDATDVRLALYDGAWKLVRRGLGEKQRFQLFDLDADPVGVQDLAAQHPEIVQRLREELDLMRAGWNADDVRDQQGTGSSNVDALKALGYAGNQPEPQRPLPGH
jgi:arylsulfatase A-like enzyme